ncbi:unnamed protein product [Rotaria sp. Silwood2]|nr:unnamed protein product [Rotaria sp. Silwood2]
MEVFNHIQNANANVNDPEIRLQHYYVEKYVQSAILYQNTTALLKKREEYAVVEDDFGPTRTQMLIHEAKAYAFAIAFYTGAYSEMLSLNAIIFARRWQRNKATNAENVQIDDNAAMIMYYVIKGLSHINFYWGRVIELGLCKYVALWVDDHIFHEWWENKGHMEKASTLGTQINIHFIPKSTTQGAMAFLRYEFGARLKNSGTFRIVTDLNRDNESSANDAGVRLLVQVRKFGVHQKCLIFTGNASEGRRKLNKIFQGNQLDDIKITEDSIDLEQFVLFK